MALNLKHLKYDATGETSEVLTAGGQSYDPPRFCWSGAVGEQNIHDGRDYQPFIWDAAAAQLRYSADDLRIVFESGAQTLKKSGSFLARTLKLFVQRETAPGVWTDQPHGRPTRQIRQNKRFSNGALTDAPGHAVGWLDFSAAPYDLQLGLAVGRSAKATLGYRFRAPLSANVRFQLVKDGIKKRAGAEAFKLLYAGGGFKGRQRRVVGIAYKDFTWRWTWFEAANRTLPVRWV